LALASLTGGDRWIGTFQFQKLEQHISFWVVIGVVCLPLASLRLFFH
jgi:hypothetical protein